MTTLTKVLKQQPKRIDISADMTPEFFAKVKKGQVLKFNKDGVIQAFRIVRLNRPRQICEVIAVDLMSEEEAKAQGRIK